MAYVDEHMHSRWGASNSDQGAAAAIANIDLGISQVTLMLEMIVDIQGPRTADSERADALTLAAAAMLGQLGRSIDALDAYITSNSRAAAPNGRHGTSGDHTSMEMLAQAVFDVVRDAIPGGKA